MTDHLRHTENITAQLQEGGPEAREAARRRHNKHVAAELERAQHEPICLSDLMAAKEAFIIDEIDREQGRA